MNRLQARIQDVIRETVRAGAPRHNAEPLWCLQSARLILERALGLPDMGLYSSGICNMRIDRRNRSWYAADFEYTCREKGWNISPSLLGAGDIVFSRFPKPDGHIGILFYPEGSNVLHVFENTMANRGLKVKGAVRITPFKDWDRVTTAARLPESLLPNTPGNIPALPVKTGTLPPNWVPVWNASGPTGKYVSIVQDERGNRKAFEVAEEKLKSARQGGH